MFRYFVCAFLHTYVFVLMRVCRTFWWRAGRISRASEPTSRSCSKCSIDSRRSDSLAVPHTRFNCHAAPSLSSRFMSSVCAFVPLHTPSSPSLHCQHPSYGRTNTRRTNTQSGTVSLVPPTGAWEDLVFRNYFNLKSLSAVRLAAKRLPGVRLLAELLCWSRGKSPQKYRGLASTCDTLAVSRSRFAGTFSVARFTDL